MVLDMKAAHELNTPFLPSSVPEQLRRRDGLQFIQQSRDQTARI
jgi:hypothetical protein